MTRRNTSKIDDLKDQHAGMATDIAVIKTQILSALNVAQEVKSDHDKIVRIETLLEEHVIKDLNALHGKMRDFKKAVNSRG